MFGKLRDGWMVFVHVLGRVQTTILLAVVYHIAVGPIALLSKLKRADLLGLKASQEGSHATEVKVFSRDLERAQKQF